MFWRNILLPNENQDFSMIEQIWAPQSDIILFGTNSEEKLMGWDNIKKAIKQQFASISETYISPSSQFINKFDTKHRLVCRGFEL